MTNSSPKPPPAPSPLAGADRAAKPAPAAVPASPRPRVMNAARPGPIRAPANRRGLSSGVEPQAFARWEPGVCAAVAGEATITIYDVIGEDIFGDGVTVNRVDAALRRIGNNAVEVHINSPGGDVFEGIAIANRLLQHPAKVTVKVMGLAASAASIIAMAGSEVLIAPSAFMMIHNCWVMAVGDRNDLRATADYLDPFDAALVDVYATRTGGDKAEIAAWMDAETWMNGTLAVERKFADGLINGDALQQDETQAANAAARAERRGLAAALTAAGHPAAQVRAHLDRIGVTTPPKPSAAAVDWSGFDAAITRGMAA